LEFSDLEVLSRDLRRVVRRQYGHLGPTEGEPARQCPGEAGRPAQPAQGLPQDDGGIAASGRGQGLPLRSHGPARPVGEQLVDAVCVKLLRGHVWVVFLDEGEAVELRVRGGFVLVRLRDGGTVGIQARVKASSGGYTSNRQGGFVEPAAVVKVRPP